MEINGHHEFATDQETMWNILMDSDAIARAIPGVDQFVPLDDEESAWRADVKMSIGPVTGLYCGFLRMSEIDAPNTYRLTVHGEGQNSLIDGWSIITLSQGREDSVRLDWTAHADISGKLTGVGQRLITATANMMSKRFFSALAKEIPGN
jgi:carbon monoxide dehydrogenase subunit G